MSVSIYALQINAYICRHNNQIRSLHVLASETKQPWVVCLGVLPILRPASQFDCIFHGNSTENRSLPVGIAWLVRKTRERATEDWENDPCALSYMQEGISGSVVLFSQYLAFECHLVPQWGLSGACLVKALLSGLDVLDSRRQSYEIPANSLVCLPSVFFAHYTHRYLQYPKASNCHSFSTMSGCVEWKFLSANWLRSKRCRVSKQCGLSSSSRTGAGPWAEISSKLKSVFWKGASRKLIASLLH